MVTKKARPTKSRDLCSGCTENFYNGNNSLGVTQCWNFKSARVILRKQVHINYVPPWNQDADYFLSCRRVRGYVFVGKDEKH